MYRFAEMKVNEKGFLAEKYKQKVPAGSSVRESVFKMSERPLSA